MGILCLIFEKSPSVFHNSYHLIFLPSPHPHQHLLFPPFLLLFFIYSHPSRCEVVSHYGSDLISLMTNNIKHHFMCIHHSISLKNCLFKSIVVVIVEFQFFIDSRYSSFFQINDLKIFSPII